ncbi:transcriptional regulator, IclR family [Desulfotomaculum nigrificans CO-1-SRB]|uniref:Glycerol operon regulatory protein n=1 Tax=Desulfotomaculum nigrificans (strain DSM 14880 / VKM B-2319 / CO-1-SRB) TaxID=868595 RepID=F6B8T1_DESCC|nr:IclR family transcriptional regulator [Desulfotomaculum nigrificans]AEF94774.1 transcriptional regulator, IclR family [Desulfotomaculum nigrificans CO-1-SRB]
MPETKSKRSGETQIRSVGKALTIINYLAESPGEMPLVKIASKLGMAKSTVHGLLSTLKDFGYIEQSPFTGNYKLGIRLFELGSIVANSFDVRTIAAPYIQQLVDKIEETVHLVTLDKGEVLYIDKRESHQSLRIVSQIGMRLPAHCTGVGKALLAYLPPEELKYLIKTKGLPRYTQNTITDPEKLEEELRRVRERGYAVDVEEIMESLCCIAAPVFDHTGKAVAAISVSGPTARLEGERFDMIVTMVMQTAKEISAGLGCRNTPGVGR